MQYSNVLHTWKEELQCGKQMHISFFRFTTLLENSFVLQIDAPEGDKKTE